MTKEEAIAFYESGKWQSMTPMELVELQFKEKYLCIPFGLFHESVEKVLGHSVWPHQFGTEGMKALEAELKAVKDGQKIKTAEEAFKDTMKALSRDLVFDYNDIDKP